MKKVFLITSLFAMMIGMAACGGGNKHSKAYNEAEKILKQVIESVDKAKTCDDLDMAAFGVIGIIAVEGIDELSDAEAKELTKYTDQIDESIDAKKASLGCEDEPFFDEDMPLDEPVEEEME